MRFPRKLLQDDEELVLDLSPHWWYLVPSGTVLASAIVLGLLSVPLGSAALSIGAAVLVVAALGYFGWKYLKWYTTDFVVTSERLIFREGLISKRGTQMPLDKVNTVDFRQAFLERLIGAGDLLIESGSERGVQRFSDIRKPIAVQHEIIRQMDLHDERDRSVVISGAGAPGGLSVAEQLEKLAALRNQGALTDAEFQAEKARLLHQPPANQPRGHQPSSPEAPRRRRV